jgi:NAD(P)-dependent dehydrogenase (short-subunit alcohol dehydrogenase family)
VDLMDSMSEQLAYVVSREAVVALSRHLALALGPLGVRVECVHPGAADTDGGPEKDVATRVLHLLSPTARLRGHTPAAGDDIHTPARA